MSKHIPLLFLIVGLLGMIVAIPLGFVYIQPSMANLFILSMGFMMSFSMTVAAGIELFKSKRN
jgi:hypothetical protein